jgi:serine/threonine-protein kinase
MDLSPDGSELVFITGEAITKSRLALRRLDQPKSVPLAGTEGAEAPFFSPDGKFIGFFADRKLKKIETSGGAPVTLCEITSPRGGSWGEDDNIVFPLSNHTGLFRVSASGGTPRPVTQLDSKRGEDAHRFPQVLPGAEAVLFMNSLDLNGEGLIQVHVFKSNARKTLVDSGAYPRYLPSGHLAYWHAGTLYAAPIDLRRLELTGSPVPLLEDVNFLAGTGTASFAFSKSGTFVYAAANPDDQLRPVELLDEKGKTEPLPLARGRYSHVRLSPDGTRLAVAMREGPSVNIWVYDRATHRFSRLTFVGGNADLPVWTPDGKYLAFFSDCQSPGPGIYITRADGAGAPQRLLHGTNTFPRGFSPNAGRLLYEIGLGAESGLWLMPLDWSDPLRPKPATAEFFARGAVGTVSPDGKWVAYADVPSGLPEIFVRPLTGGGGPWQISSGGDLPVWSSHTGELLYVGLPSFRIMAASYSTRNDSLTHSPPRAWSEIRVNDFDVMPDGRHVIMISSGEQKPVTHAMFLFNFMDDLRRRVPAGK